MGKKKAIKEMIGNDDDDILSESHWYDTDEVEGVFIDEFFFDNSEKELKEFEKKVPQPVEEKVNSNSKVSKEEVKKRGIINSLNISTENEEYDVTKNVRLRKSTVNMVTEMRMMHPNVNIRISRIIDDSIRCYYGIIKDQGGFAIEEKDNLVSLARNFKAEAKILNNFYEERENVPFDDRVNNYADIGDLKLDLIKEYFRSSENELYWQVGKQPIENLLGEMNVLEIFNEEVKVKNIGLLMFSDTPERFFPSCQIEVVNFNDVSEGKNFSEQIFTGSIYTQLLGVLIYIRNSVIKEKVIKLNEEGNELKRFNYPDEAIKEALVNAVYHRDYLDNNPIEVRIEKEEIAIISYPGADKSIKIQDINKGKVIARRYRNRRLGEFLKAMKFADGRATGLSKVIECMEKNNSPKPIFETDEERTYFLVRLPINSCFLEGRAQDRVQDEAQDRFKELYINDTEKRILELLDEKEMSKKEIIEALGYGIVNGNLKRSINRLLKVNIITYTLPNRPNSRYQKYKLLK